MERLDVFCGRERAGELTWTEEGLYLRMELSCALRQDGIYRAFAVGEGGELPLGVLEPVSGLLRLSKRLPRKTVADIGPLLHGEMRLPGQAAEPDGDRQGWQSLATAADFFRGGPFYRELREVRGALWRQEEPLRFLALPFDSRRPFLLSSLFCFARLRRIAGREYAVFTFDSHDYPVFNNLTRNL